MRLGFVLAAIACGAVLFRAPSGRATALLAASAIAASGIQAAYVMDQIQRTDASANWGVTEGSLDARDWIDDAVGDSDPRAVALVPSRFGDDPFVETAVWWDTEFWNESVGSVYSYDDLSYDTLPQKQLRLESFYSGRLVVGRLRSLSEGGEEYQPAGERYLAVSGEDTRFRPAGAVVASRRREGFGRIDVIEPDRPWRADWATQGLFSDGYLQPGEPAELRIYAEGRSCRRSVTVELRSPRGQDAPVAFEVAAVRRRSSGHVAPGGTADARVEVGVPRRSFASVTLRSDLATNQASLEREVGLRISRVAVGPCRASEPRSRTS